MLLLAYGVLFMRQLLIASGNPGKLREIQALLADMKFELVDPSQLGIHLEVVEDGDTYAENAARKALAFTQATGLYTLADDSGLEVEALGGLPGLHSARFAPHPGATDADRRALLLKMLAAHPRPWKAKFHCTVAIASHPEKSTSLKENVPERSSQMNAGRVVLVMIPFSSSLSLEKRWQNWAWAKKTSSAIGQELSLRQSQYCKSFFRRVRNNRLLPSLHSQAFRLSYEHARAC
jgi:non-canonical purine NTP pyrophosphatase (RdgB/HAM1 family)